MSKSRISLFNAHLALFVRKMTPLCRHANSHSFRVRLNRLDHTHLNSHAQMLYSQSFQITLALNHFDCGHCKTAMQCGASALCGLAVCIYWKIALLGRLLESSDIASCRHLGSSFSCE